MHKDEEMTGLCFPDNSSLIQRLLLIYNLRMFDCVSAISDDNMQPEVRTLSV